MEKLDRFEKFLCDKKYLAGDKVFTNDNMLSVHVFVSRFLKGLYYFNLGDISWLYALRNARPA